VSGEEEGGTSSMLLKESCENWYLTGVAGLRREAKYLFKKHELRR
jgi:hypothetical protein